MHSFHVQDMSCNHCVATITRALKEIDGTAGIDIDLPGKRVNVDSKLAPQVLTEAILQAGFTPLPI